MVADLVAANSDLRGKVDELIAEQRKAKEAGDVGAIEKHGVSTGRSAINPYNGEKVPIWVANYVLMDYGTGAIMSVPAHDERDYEFAKKYDLDIRVVIMPRREGDAPDGEPSNPLLPFTETNSLLINSGEYSGLPNDEAIAKMSKHAEEHGFGKATVTYKLRDWGISRQRYWGTPIPMVYCPKDGIVPVAEKDLPVVLPDNVEHHVGAWLAAGPGARVREHHLSQVRRPSSPRNRHHGYLRRFVLVLLSLHRSDGRYGAFRRKRGGLLVSH